MLVCHSPSDTRLAEPRSSHDSHSYSVAGRLMAELDPVQAAFATMMTLQLGTSNFH